MWLVGFTVLDVVAGVMWVSLGIIALVIIYRQILRKFSVGSIDRSDYCELYDLDTQPVLGEVKFYFTSKTEREVKMCVYDDGFNKVKEVKVFLCKAGGNIVRFDSSELPNGNYYYGLETENQKIMKKMRLQNAKT
jgi:hypothetical protein